MKPILINAQHLSFLSFMLTSEVLKSISSTKLHIHVNIRKLNPENIIF